MPPRLIKYSRRTWRERNGSSPLSRRHGPKAGTARRSMVPLSRYRATPRLSGSSSQSGVLHRRRKKDHAEDDFNERKCLRNPRFAPATGDALGQIAEDQHARPLVGIAPAAQ